MLAGPQEAALSPQSRARATSAGPRSPLTLLSALLAALLVPLLVLLSSGQAVAEPRAPGVNGDPAADAARSALDASSHTPLSAPLPDADEPAADDTVTVSEYSEPVAPGVEVETLRTVDAVGWQRSNVLTVDLSKGARFGYLDAGRVTSTSTISAMADKAGAAAAVNGDFFDINNSNAPLGGAVRDGGLIKSPQADHKRSATFDAAGIGELQDLLFTGSAALPSGKTELAQLNAASLGKDQIGGYTQLWGGFARSHAVSGATEVTEVTVVDGTVDSVTDAAGEGEIPAGATVLLGREKGARTLAALKKGDPVEVSLKAAAADGTTPDTSVGGRYLLVSDGVAQDPPDDSRAARMAIGFSADGRKVSIVTADGTNVGSRAATLREMGDRLVAEGAEIGMELDGGGSATMVARRAGDSAVQVRNTPNDGHERQVPNGLAVYAPKSSGAVRAYRVGTAIDPAQAPTTAPIPGGRPDRVFAGLTRKLTAVAHDEAFSPVKDAPTPGWTASKGTVDNATFHAKKPGTAKVTARSGRAKGSVELQVLGAATRIGADSPTVNIAGDNGTGAFGIVGYDEHGNSAPVEPADVELDYDTKLLDITPGANGRFTAKAHADSGGAVVTATVGELTTSIGVTIGVERHDVATFDDAADWTAGSARGTAEVAAADGQNGAGLRLSYDFSLSTGTRTAYANPPAPLGVEGRTRAVGISVFGASKGEWTAFTVVDATGKAHSIYGPYITWDGWKEIEIPVPEALPQPVTVSRFYTIETSAARSYTGEVLLDDMYLSAAPALDVPPDPPARDDVVVTDGDLDRSDWRFAVMSDAQFVARDPDSPLVQGARRTLREIRAEKPEFLVIAGDLVDEASDADFDLAKRILDEELDGKLPYYYVPGNHEVMGASIDNFVEHFGDTHRSFDHKGTRFITLDTSTGTLRGSTPGQIGFLNEQLDAARKDASVDSVAVIQHHPPRDPLPAKNSQLADRKEAALIEDWLGDFQHDTGKGAVFVGGHVGAFSASGVDGVPYIVNGNSAKTPAGGTEEGGFSGWTMFGADRVSAKEQKEAAARPFQGGPDWISAEIRPHVDALRLSAPEKLRIGKSADVAAELTQGDRTVEVAYPVSADWTAGANVHVGRVGGTHPRDAIAVFDPEAGTLRALRTGKVTLGVRVNGVSEKVEVSLTR